MDTREKRKTGHSQRRSAPAESRRKRSSAQTANRKRRRTQTDRESVRQTRKQRPSREVTYTPAKPFSRNRFLLQLVTVVAVVIAVIIGMSIFFKVETVMVFGNEKYSAWVVRDASGIQDKENLLTLGRTRAVSRILDELPYVKQARIGIKLPDTVNIYIDEFDVVYSVKEKDGAWWLIRSDGILVEQTDAASATDYTQILGVEIFEPAVGQPAIAAEEVTVPETTQEPDPTEETLVLQPVVVTAAQQLDTALQILRYMEENDIIGKAANVDVSNLGEIQLWYGDQYQVELGDTEKLDYKIWYMKSAIDQMEDYQSGVLDVSFTIWTDKAGFNPF